MSLRVVINQSNYIPWKGYFDLIHDADIFVFLDDVQYTKNDWRNRNRIKTARGAQWLTIPVGPKHDRQINKVTLPSDPAWMEQHWSMLLSTYGSAPHFARYADLIESSIRHCPYATLSELNHHLIREVSRHLEIPTRFVHSESLGTTHTKQERVIEILKKLGANSYVSGPAAKAYLEPSRFETEGIELIWKDYQGYPEYAQFHPPFEHSVSVLDVLFHCGPASSHYVWGWRKRTQL
ncbi:MAG TPA: WbqC family protein [Opitutaceae bacterium]|nr:WbqC family protein [Opitutaceae bacterium]